MKAAKIYDFDDIRIEDIDIPQIGARDALVQIKACGICSSDVMPWYIKRKAPTVIGHEPAGVIVEVGEEVEDFRKGDRVFIHHHAPCFVCRVCSRGHFAQCATWKKTHIVPGGIAEYIKVPELNLKYDTLRLPEHISCEDGALVEPTACSVKAIKRANAQTGDIVLVIGLGVMGQLNTLLARHYGAKLIIGADLVKYRLNKAIEFGADFVVDVAKEPLKEKVNEITAGLMADVVIVGPGSIPAMKSGLECVGKGGTVLFFTPTPEGETLEINPYELYSKEVTLTHSYSCGPYDTRDALDIIEIGVVSAEKFVTHRFGIEQTLEAYRNVAEANNSLKTLIVFE